MTAIERNLIKRVGIKTSTSEPAPSSKAYRGISTVDPDRRSVRLYDLELIKQDLINHFHIRQGEKLENPAFGTIIWDVIFEQLTEELKEAIATNVTTIINYDPRIVVNTVTVDSYETGIQIECDLTYLPYSISDQMQLKFDQNNSIIA